jgi:hypothetical protein
MKYLLWSLAFIFFSTLLFAQTNPLFPAMWSHPQPVRSVLNVQWSQSSCSNPDGSIVLVWSDSRLGGLDLYAQKMDADGNPLWGANGIPVEQKTGRQESSR